jgi:Uri superfamily endonuclease
MTILLPKTKGAYALHLHVASPSDIQIGRLGRFSFPAGDYIYLGSALGPGGLAARINRHVRGDGHLHWHIDYLREKAVLIGFCYFETEQRLECLWSQTLASLPQACIPVLHFGNSDCKIRGRSCAAHLVSFRSGFASQQLQEMLAAASGMSLSSLRYCSFICDSKGESGYME